MAASMYVVLLHATYDSKYFPHDWFNLPNIPLK